MEEKLKAAGIPPEQWEYCYISDDGTIWTPSTDEDGTVLANGKDMYDYYISHKDDPPPTPDPGEDDEQVQLLKKQIAELQSKLDDIERGVLNG